MRILKAILIFAGMMLAAQAFGASAKFATTVTYPVGSDGANSVVSVDVNGDSFPDIVVATNNGVSVLINNGDGTYGPPTTYATGGPLSDGLAVVDVNNDGLPDIIVTNMCTTATGCWGVSVLLNNPNNPGTFESANNFDSGGLETGGVAVADVNNDGNPDLVLTSNCQPLTCAGGDLTLLLGNGDGTFQPYLLIADAKGPVAIGDMNNDGNPDLVTGAGVMLGNGDGTFQAAIPTVAGGAIAIALTDVNGDGNLDVISAIPTGVAVQLGTGTGGLSTQTNYTTGGKNPLWIAIADFNGDNYPDIAVVNECVTLDKQVCTGSANVGVLSGTGTGIFNAAVAFLTGGETGTSVSAADVNQDGKIDLVASNVCTTAINCNTGSVGVLINDYVTATATKITSSLNPAGLGVQITFTATVTGVAGGSGPPDGSEVDFYDGANDIGPGFTVHGVATFTTSLSTAGVQVIKAVYSSSDPYHNGSSGSLVETIEPYSTTVSVSSTLNPSSYGQSVSLMAQVVSSGGNIPTGIVSFKNGSTLIGNGTLNGSGVATVTSSLLPVGTLNVTASYLGDPSDAKSTSAVFPQTVNPAQLTMSLNSTPNPQTAGKIVKFTATITSTGKIPTGSVAFSYNGTALGTGVIAPSGIAIFSTTALPSGSDQVTATFTGNTDYSNASASITQGID